MSQRIDSFDFSKMTIDLSKLSAGQSFLEAFPHLSHKKIYQEATDNEIKVGIAICDPGSPFANIRKFDDRLIAAFEYFKLDRDGEDMELFQQIISLQSETVAAIWVEHLSSVFDHEWTSWFSNSILYYQLNAEIRKPIDFKSNKDWQDRVNMEGKADQVYKRMKEMEEILFIDKAIKRRAAEKHRELIVNYTEKHAQVNSVI